MTYKIRTISGQEYTTDHDMLQDSFAHWVPCTDADGHLVHVHLETIEAVEPVAAKKPTRKKVETK